MPSESDTQFLYDEFSAIERAQADLHRWKAVSLGAIFSLALGFAATSAGDSIFALAGIPFITLYVDSLIRGYDLQIATLLSFLSGRAGEVADYVRSREDAPVSTGTFSNIATVASSALANLGAFLYVLSRSDPLRVPIQSSPSSSGDHLRCVLLWTLGVGFVGAFFVSLVSCHLYNLNRAKKRPSPNAEQMAAD